MILFNKEIKLIEYFQNIIAKNEIMVRHIRPRRFLEDWLHN